MVMVPTLVTSSIGVGWARSLGGLLSPAQDDASEPSTVSGEGGIQIHPDTRPEDPAYQMWGPKDREESLI